MKRKRNSWQLILLALLFITGAKAHTGSYKFYFGEGIREGFQTVKRTTLYGKEESYGYDLIGAPMGEEPFFFSV